MFRYLTATDTFDKAAIIIAFVIAWDGRSEMKASLSSDFDGLVVITTEMVLEETIH